MVMEAIHVDPETKDTHYFIPALSHHPQALFKVCASVASAPLSLAASRHWWRGPALTSCASAEVKEVLWSLTSLDWCCRSLWAPDRSFSLT